MNYKNKFVMSLCSSALALSANVNASSLTTPVTFATGDTLSAASLNSNMSAVETAVNDNDSRVTTLESQAVTTSSSLTSLSTSVSSNASDILALESTVNSVVSVGHGSFSISEGSQLDDYGLCTFNRAIQNYLRPVDNPSATFVTCFGVASVQLPHGKNISGLECTFLDNTSANNMNAHLTRVDLRDGSTDSIMRTSSTSDSGIVQTQSSSTLNTSGADEIDNSVYAYNMFLNFSATNFTNLASTTRFYGCRITVN